MGADAFRDEDLNRVVAELNATSERMEEQFSVYWESLDDIVASAQADPLDRIRGRVSTSLNELTGLFLELSLAKASARLESIVMKEVRVETEYALRMASQKRLDWMNARAALVDAWRQADLARDDLRTDLDLVL